MSEAGEGNCLVQEEQMIVDTSPHTMGPPNEILSEEPNDEETVVIDPESEELDLNHHRIAKIQDFEPLTKLKKLCLRWNLIKKIENLSTLSTLTELELYDNQITEIENLEALTNLEYVLIFNYKISA